MLCKFLLYNRVTRLHVCIHVCPPFFDILRIQVTTDSEQSSMCFIGVITVAVVHSLSCVQLFATPTTAAGQAPLSSTISQNSLQFMFIDLVMPSHHLILFHPLLVPSVFPSIMVFSSEPALHTRWPKYWCFSFRSSPTNEYSGLISFTMDWFDLLAVQGVLKSLLQHHFVRFHIYAKIARIFVMKNLYLFLCESFCLEY